jgi:hypothetical protein
MDTLDVVIGILADSQPRVRPTVRVCRHCGERADDALLMNEPLCGPAWPGGHSYEDRPVCPACFGSGAGRGPDADGQHDPCDFCDGSGIAGGR